MQMGNSAVQVRWCGPCASLSAAWLVGAAMVEGARTQLRGRRPQRRQQGQEQEQQQPDNTPSLQIEVISRGRLNGRTGGAQPCRQSWRRRSLSAAVPS